MNWVWHVLFPLAPGICLLRRRLLYFLWRLLGFTAFTVCLGSAVMSLCSPSVTVWTTVVGWTGTGDTRVCNSVPSPVSTKVKSSDVALHVTSGKASLLDEVSLWDASFGTISSCVLNCSISFIKAFRSDHGSRDSSLDEEAAWSGLPEEDVGKRGTMGDSFWR